MRFLLFLRLFLLFICAPIFAEESTPYKQIIATKINQLELQQKTPETVKQLAAYQAAQNQLEKIKDFNQATRRYEELTETYPEQKSAIKEQIDNFSATEFPEFSDWGHDQLTLEIAGQDTKLIQLELSRQSSHNILIKIENGIDDFSYQANKLRTKKQDLIQKLSQAKRVNNTEERMLLQIAEQYTNSHLAMLEAEQLSAGKRRELAKLHLQYENLLIEAHQAYRNNLQNTLNHLLRSNMPENSSKNQKQQANIQNQPEVIQQQLTLNNRLYSELTTLSSNIEQTQQLTNVTNEQIAETTQTEGALKIMASWLKVSPIISENLRNRLQDLPANPPIDKLNLDVARNQIHLYDYQQQLALLKKNQDKISTENLSEQQIERLHSLIQDNLTLYGDINKASETLIYQQAKLKVLYERLDSMLTTIKSESAKLLFWAPNTNPLSLDGIKQTGERIQWFFSPTQWLKITKVPYFINAYILFISAIAITLLLTFLYFAKKHWLVYLEKTSKYMNRVTVDKFRYSYMNVAIAFLLACPIPLIISIVGYTLSLTWQLPFIFHLGQALLFPYALVVYFFIRELCRDNGLFISHFGWSETLVNNIFRYYKYLMIVFIPALILQQFTFFTSELETTAPLGRLAFVISNIAISVFNWQLWKLKIPIIYGKLPQGKAHIGHHIFWWVLIIIPQVFNCAALYGYLSTAQNIMLRIQQGAIISAVTVLIYFLIKRLMLIQKRRLAFERAKAKRQEIMNQSQDENYANNELDIEEPKIDLDRISAQSLRLLHSMSLVYLLILCWLFADLYQATSLLKSVALWDITHTINGVDQLNTITLHSILLAILAIGLTIILTRDLPSAMELLILQHLNLSPGTSYAITSVTRYLAIFIGVIVGSTLIGFDWSKIQWLVAALGVGIGFGMQEIFANFISGLILLFEKPIRIGDTVTIRNLTGVVAKIKTRATTIVDWDRKEVIVPNRAFVTEQFINWSLSDAVTRVKLSINVKLKADPELVTQLLFEAAEECELVLDNPAPEVFFLGLTANCQQFELRAYAAETGHRLSLTHDLHCRIKNKFMKHHIDIASPQLEVTMKGQQYHPVTSSKA
ncbi:mechanosensitive ion channel domain-containing protein [Photobacterium leiognathi]|uniref:mechanosensitive ion channel domain-containing protein n=1 Tax=Photobacterium leiognathi TaxID=553611 RepID=UPI0029813AD4|nr:mechanosensitive ion channel domain-containing protein [Photobacterium leiognathi]